MFGLGFTEILVILTVALLVFGPKRLPEIARTIGKTMGELRRTLDDVKFEMNQAEQEVHRQEPENLPQEQPSSGEALEETVAAAPDTPPETPKANNE